MERKREQQWERQGIYVTCKNGDCVGLRWLWSNRPDAYFSLLFERACTLGYPLAGIQCLVEDCQVDPHYNGCEFPLQRACANGFDHIVKYLVEKCDCNANAICSNALNCAAINGHFSTVQYLVENTEARAVDLPGDIFERLDRKGYHKIAMYLEWALACNF